MSAEDSLSTMSESIPDEQEYASGSDCKSPCQRSTIKSHPIIIYATDRPKENIFDKLESFMVQRNYKTSRERLYTHL